MSSLIYLFVLFQLWVSDRQQDGVHGFGQPHRGEVPGKPHHQLGRDSVGEPPPRVMGGAGRAGHHQPDGGAAAGLSRLQGKTLLRNYNNR